MNDYADLELEASFDLVLRFADDGDGRTLSGYAVPWDQPAYVRRPVKGFESYRRGALTRSLNESKTPIVLLGLHRESEPLGTLADSFDDDYGQHVTFRMVNTTAARDARELVESGIWRGLSIGGTAVPSRTTVTRRSDGELEIVRSEIRWDHVALVRKPAFAGAAVTALRADEGDPRDMAEVVAARKRNRERMLRASAHSATARR